MENEEEGTTQAEAESATKDNGNRVSEMVQRAEKAAAELKEQNDRSEQLMAEAALGGKSFGGENQEKKAEISDADYAKQVLAGKL